MRALALHPDVLLVTSALLQANCVIVRGPVSGDTERVVGGTLRVEQHGPGTERSNRGETFVIDSPVLPDELDALPALVEQARFTAPSGLLATHGDWDHLLARLAFPGAALGVAESTAERLEAAPGEAQRLLRTFDEELLIDRPQPLPLGSLQALQVPGRCEVGDLELELHPTAGHTADGMAVAIPWASVLLPGDYLSSVELPTLDASGDIDAYLATLERLRPLVAVAAYTVPGHGPVLDAARAGAVLEEDVLYLRSLTTEKAAAQLPPGRRGAVQRRLHTQNVARCMP